MNDVPPRSYPAWKIALVLAAAAAILVVRRTDALVNPQFYNEDGRIFFLEQYNEGASAILRTYAGYFHLVPRLIAWAADAWVPYSAIPAVYNCSALVITLLAISSVFSPRFVAAHKPWLALSIVMVPHYSGEILMVFMSVQWILAIVLVVVLLKEPPDRKYGNVALQYASDLALIVVCGLTGPFAVLLSPFYAWRWFRERSVHSGVTFAVLALVALPAVVPMILEPTHPLHVWPTASQYCEVFGQRCFGNLFLGVAIPYEISPYLLAFLYAETVVVLLYLAFPNNRLALVAVGVHSATVFAALGKKISVMLCLIQPAYSERYFYVPYVMLTWTLLALFERGKRWRNFLLGAALGLALISSLMSGFRCEPYLDFHWKQWSEKIGKEDVEVPINAPDNLKIAIRARQP